MLSRASRDQGVTGQPVSIMVEGVQVTLPSYEEAVNGGGPPTPAPGGSESRVQIVLSEGEQSPEAGPSRPSSHQHSEMAVVHTLPPSFSSSSCSSSSPSPSSSCWALEHHAGAAGAPPSHNKPTTSREQHSLSLVDSEMDFSDGKGPALARSAGQWGCQNCSKLNIPSKKNPHRFEYLYLRIMSTTCIGCLFKFKHIWQHITYYQHTFTKTSKWAKTADLALSRTCSLTLSRSLSHARSLSLLRSRSCFLCFSTF